MAKRRRRRRDRQPHSEITGLMVIALAILAGASLLTGMEGTQSVGVIGKFLNRLQLTIAGEYALFIPFGLLLWGARMVFFPNSQLFARRAMGASIIVTCILTAVHILAAEALDDWRAVMAMTDAGQGGGVIGALGTIALYKAFGLVGSVVVLTSSTFIGIFLLMNISLKQILSLLFEGIKKGMASLVRGLGKINKWIQRVVTSRGSAEKAEPSKPTPTHPVTIHDYQAAEDGDTQEETPQPEIEEPLPQTEGQADPRPESVQPTVSQEDIAMAQELEAQEQQEQDMVEMYQLPPLNLLQKTIRLKDPQGRRELVSQADILEETLTSFGIDAKVINVHRGPTITRFEIQPAAGVKVSRIVNLADDLALSLAATGVRIEAPIPGKSAIGLEMANKAKATVYLREVLETPQFLDNSSKLAIALGKDIAGEPVIADMMKIPHLLIAGATGSGKSVCLNAIIASLLYKAKPNELKFMLIDPKVVELNVYNGLPHLLCPVVTDPRVAAQGLKNIVREMEQRYQLFAQSGVRDLGRYNEWAQQKGEKPLPFIIVIIDELADLMMTAATEVEDTICRIAQKSRAAGIHLIVATQRPSVDVITGVIKANITTRIAFAVSSQADSRTILDVGGAEKLLGQGDMLYLPVGASKPRRLQSAYLADDEVEKIVAHVLGQTAPVVRADFLEPSEEELETPALEMDELLPEAAQMVVDSGQASISMLQRRLRIGYTRAARLIDDMEQLGIVGGYEGSKARKILVTSAQLEEVLKGIKE